MNESNMTHLRVLYSPFLPHVNYKCPQYLRIKKSNSCPYLGFSVEMLNLIASRLGLTIVPVVDYSTPGEVDYGANENGKIVGIVNYLLNGTVDTLAMTYANDKRFHSHFAFSDSVFFASGRVLAIRPLEHFGRYFAFFGSYKQNAWIGIAVSLLIQCIFSIFVQTAETKLQKKRPTHWADVVWKMMRLQLLQPQNCQSSLISGKVSILIFSLAQCAVIMGVLSSYLLSHIIKPPNPVPFTNLQEMIIGMEKNEVHIIETFRTRVEEEVMTLGTVMGINMTKVSQYNPIRRAKDSKHALMMLREPGTVIIRYDDEDLFYQAVGDCDVVTKEEILPPSESSFIFTKDFPLLPAVNRIILEEKLEIAKLRKKYMKNFKKKMSCKSGQQYGTGSAPYYGLAFVLLALDMIATMILLVELMFGHVIHAKE